MVNVVCVESAPEDTPVPKKADEENPLVPVIKQEEAPEDVHVREVLCPEMTRLGEASMVTIGVPDKATTS